jgi:putative ABC transport system permease protein
MLAATAVSVPQPSWPGLIASAALVAVSAGLVMRVGAGLTRRFAFAMAMAAIQLLAVGYLLRIVFAHGGLSGTLAWLVAMMLAAGQVAGHRGAGVPHARLIGTTAIIASGSLTIAVVVGTGGLDSSPHVLLPVGGMIVSAAMVGTSLILMRLQQEAQSSRARIEARLALGLSSREAFAPHLRSALRTALTPQLDSTTTVGLISLPGAMTGLIIAGVSPVLAIRYQILVMYTVLGTAATAAVLAAMLAQRSMFDDAHRLRRLTPTANQNRSQPLPLVDQ